MAKYLYLIDNVIATREVFKNNLALIYADTSYVGPFPIKIANYKRAEGVMRKMRKNKHLRVFSAGNIYSVKKLEPADESL